MNSSRLARVVAATGIAVGLSAVAAPAALADGYIANGGDVAVQQVGNAEDSAVIQPAQNHPNISTEVEDSIAGSFNNND